MIFLINLNDKLQTSSFKTKKRLDMINLRGSELHFYLHFISEMNKDLLFSTIIVLHSSLFMYSTIISLVVRRLSKKWL